MKELVLTRFAETPVGVFGKLRVSDRLTLYTVERPWLNNIPYQSCIPYGKYQLQESYYHRGNYSAYEVLKVPGRSHIKIHIGNTMDDVVGCIAVGKDLGYISNKWAVTHSRLAFRQFMAEMNGESGTLLIKDLEDS